MHDIQTMNLNMAAEVENYTPPLQICGGFALLLQFLTENYLF